MKRTKKLDMKKLKVMSNDLHLACQIKLKTMKHIRQSDEQNENIARKEREREREREKIYIEAAEKERRDSGRKKKK